MRWRLVDTIRGWFRRAFLPHKVAKETPKRGRIHRADGGVRIVGDFAAVATVPPHAVSIEVKFSDGSTRAISLKGEQ